MGISFNEAVTKIDKTLKTGQIFNVVGGEIFFCICQVPNDDRNNNGDDGNNEFDIKVGKHFEKSFNTRFTNMVVDIKVKPVNVEVIGICSGNSIEQELIKHYWTNPSFIYLDNNNSNNNNSNSSGDSNKEEYQLVIRLYSLPKEWSSNHTLDSRTFTHSHLHSHTHSHDGITFTHTHNGNTHTHKLSELEPHTHLHEHTHPELEETYQNMNFH